MIQLSLDGSGHDFKKQNLVTERDSRGLHDRYKCKHCGLEGKSRSLGNVSVRRNKKCSYVPPVPVIKKIEVIECRAVGKHFSNLKPKSQHKTVKAPPPYKDDDTGVWVMGVGEPVKLLNYEFKIIQ